MAGNSASRNTSGVVYSPLTSELVLFGDAGSRDTGVLYWNDLNGLRVQFDSSTELGRDFQWAMHLCDVSLPLSATLTQGDVTAHCRVVLAWRGVDDVTWSGRFDSTLSPTGLLVVGLTTRQRCSPW